MSLPYRRPVKSTYLADRYKLGYNDLKNATKKGGFYKSIGNRIYIVFPNKKKIYFMSYDELLEPQVFPSPKEKHHRRRRFY